MTNLKYELREATLFDASILYHWRNDPSVLAQSGNSASVTWNEHIDWLNKTWYSIAYRLWIFEIDGKPAGQIRFDNKYIAATLSYSLDRGYRGHGYAADMLRMGTKLVLMEWPGIDNLQANVKNENIASIKALQSAGWQLDACMKEEGMVSMSYKRVR